MNPWVSHLAVALLGLGIGYLSRGAPAEPTARERGPVAEDAGVEASPGPSGVAPGVTGVGGIFFRSQDHETVRDWYRTNLGVGSDEGTFVFQWLEEEDPGELGYTVWGIFPATTEYFAPSDSPVMINFRVHDLRGLLDRLREHGVEIAGELEEHPNGAFAWIMDPEGRKIELWEPVPSADDPYLPG